MPENASYVLSHYLLQGCCLTNISGAQKGKSQKVRSPTGNVLGAAAKMQKNLGAQRTFLGAPGCWAPVRQQPCTYVHIHSGTLHKNPVQHLEIYTDTMQSVHTFSLEQCVAI